MLLILGLLVLIANLFCLYQIVFTNWTKVSWLVLLLNIGYSIHRYFNFFIKKITFQGSVEEPVLHVFRFALEIYVVVVISFILKNTLEAIIGDLNFRNKKFWKILLFGLIGLLIAWAIYSVLIAVQMPPSIDNAIIK